MAFLRASLRAATHIGYATNISMSKVNYLLWESIERNQFVTAFYGILDGDNGALAYSNAGHNPPLLVNAAGTSRFIHRGEQPLGMFPDTRYHEYHLEFEPGDVLVLYTDGATEAASPSGEEFGRERLAQAVKEFYDRPAREMIASLQMKVLEWTGHAGANDDVTFFIIKAPK
jgi:sigma-B regulation protein RsbU (phosphoserine phosphatase)